MHHIFGSTTVYPAAWKSLAASLKASYVRNLIVMSPTSLTSSLCTCKRTLTYIKQKEHTRLTFAIFRPYDGASKNNIGRHLLRFGWENETETSSENFNTISSRVTFTSKVSLKTMERLHSQAATISLLLEDLTKQKSQAGTLIEE